MTSLAIPDRTFGRLEWHQGFWQLRGLPPHVSLKFKSMFAKVAKTRAGEFDLKDTSTTATDLLWFMQRFPMAMGEDARKRLERSYEHGLNQAAEAHRIMADDWVPSPVAAFKPDRSPYPFQAQNGALAARLGRLLIMDDVGLGKTISSLAAIAESGHLPAAIVVQAHLTEQWVDEYITPFTTMTAHIITGTKPYELPKADLYIFKYSNIVGWVDIAAADVFKAVVFDEVQELRHGTETSKGRAAKVFSQHARMRIGLTATPIYNYGAEIYNVVQAIEPGALGTFGEFCLEWCSGFGPNATVMDPSALGAYLRDEHLAVRRTEGDVGKQMPPVNVIMHDMDFDHKASESFEEETKRLALKVLHGSFMESGQAARELDIWMRQITGIAKAKGVAALVRMLVASGEKVLLAGWHREVYSIWLDELRDLFPVMYTGTETGKGKLKAKRAFMDGTSKVMIISLRSGAGLDGLQHSCRTVVFGELDWSPQVHKQVIGRLRRPGQQGQVDAIYATTNGGSDPVIIEMLGLKSSQSQGITDPFSGTVQQHSDDGRIKRLAQAYLDQIDGEAARP
ncbi:DEAD/DEAH box helicase [Devosia sp. SD17-2]|uniref:SNF2-related protein n=1 Tax=Devosia sp. SD17-2 TaxID=2976459 RepID=UPI0023D830B7|nr:DEAD/DEAH box helicase [Devosia sp. SD17-2]WEJ33878.1 DEAD/DEAH box helicase [Devosia sp. SD17-2]